MIPISRVLAGIAMCVSLGTSDPTHAKPLPGADLPEGAMVVLQRGACEHRCAVYKVTIFADGSVIFDGQHYVRYIGEVKSRISPLALQQILADAETLQFFDLKDRYGYDDDLTGCDSILSDAPKAIISIRSGGRSKTVMHHHRCVGAESERLNLFEETIDKATNTVRWVR